MDKYSKRRRKIVSGWLDSLFKHLVDYHPVDHPEVIVLKAMCYRDTTYELVEYKINLMPEFSNNSEEVIKQMNNTITLLEICLKRMTAEDSYDYVVRFLRLNFIYQLKLAEEEMQPITA